MRSKNLCLMLFAGLACFGLAYAEDAPKDNAPKTEVPSDTPEYFLDRYGLFVTKAELKPIELVYKPVRELREKIEKASKELEKLRKKETNPERERKKAALEALLADLDAKKALLLPALEAPVAQFWASRDPDPTTPENEFKKEIDERISDIAEERFFTSADTGTLTFNSNGGFRGDMAKVYLLHGLPNATGTIEGSTYFSDLMLWLYLDEDGDPLYAFLFYERFDNHYSLFNQDQYKMDICGAFNELLKFKNHSYTRAPNGQCPAEIQMAAQQLQMAMPTRGDLQGYVFFWAVLNFSKDPSMNAGKAMEPPMSAKVSAEKSGARVAGEAPKLEPIDGSTYLFSDCPSCKSMIPGQLTLSEDEFYIIVVAGYVDWSLQGDQATSPLKARVVLEDRNTGKVTVFETDLTITASRQNIDSSIIFKLSLLSAQEVGSLPRSRYRVGVYLSNALTNKYNSWEYFWTNILLQHQQ